MFIFAANLTKPFETEKKIPRFLAETEDFFFFARKVRSCRVKSHKLRVSDEPEFLCFLVDEDKRSLMVIGDYAVEDGVFESHLEDAYFLAGREAEAFHDFYTVNGGLEVADAVFLLDIYEFFTNELVVLTETFLTLFILARDVGLAKKHEVVNVVSGVKKETTDGRVRHFIVSNVDGAHVEVYEFLHILHALVEGKLHSVKERLHHLHS